MHAGGSPRGCDAPFSKESSNSLCWDEENNLLKEIPKNTGDARSSVPYLLFLSRCARLVLHFVVLFSLACDEKLREKS